MGTQTNIRLPHGQRKSSSKPPSKTNTAMGAGASKQWLNAPLLLDSHAQKPIAT